jgi:hypothetical protein
MEGIAGTPEVATVMFAKIKGICLPPFLVIS